MNTVSGAVYIAVIKPPAILNTDGSRIAVKKKL
jgi:hypothetical protein